MKVVLDARHLNSNTNQELESWPIEPLAPQLARANKKYKSTIDLMYAYAHTPLDEETIKLTRFSSGDTIRLYPWILWIKRTSKSFHKTNVNLLQITYRQTICVSLYR